MGITKKEKRKVIGRHLPLLTTQSVTRRSFLGMASAAGMTVATRGLSLRALAQAEPGEIEELVIDLSSEVLTLDPALVYDIDGWSIVHSVYDSLVQYTLEGELQPVLAKSLTQVDPTTWEIELLPDISFHNGEPLTSSTITYGVSHLTDPDVASQAGGNFAVIKNVEEVSDLKARLNLTQPAPWLPSVLAPWLVAIPALYALDNDFAANPVGTGPYKFLEWESGDHITLEANWDYFPSSPKGQPIANLVTFRFVPEPSTRVADLLSGSAGIIRTIPDQAQPVEDGGAILSTQPVSGAAFVRIATDVEPFDDPKVRQALNYAVDVDGIIQALLLGNGQRLASLFVEGGLGYDPNLAPFSYDPEKAKSLLAQAGLADGFSTQLEHTTDTNPDLIAAIVGQLAEVGIEIEVQPRDTAAFNQTWKDVNAAPLRFVTWRPLFDPYTLLSLVVSNQGFLSRYSSDAAQPLIDSAAIEAEPSKRAVTYQQLSRVLQDDPAAIYLYNLTALYGTAADVPEWTLRPDDYIIATSGGS